MPKEEDVPIGEFNEDALELFYFVGIRWIWWMRAIPFMHNFLSEMNMSTRTLFTIL